MTTSAERIRGYRGPALLSYGFRPFFLFGAIWAAIAVALWLPLLAGVVAFLGFAIVFAPLLATRRDQR